MTVYKDVARRSNAQYETRVTGDDFIVACSSCRCWSTSSIRSFLNANRYSANGLGVLRLVFMLFVMIGLTSLGCQTDQVAQMRIDEMRAEQMAIEDRYAALRNEYEKVRRRLVAQGDPLAKTPGEPSALPLVYPPGSSGLDDMSDVYFPESHSPEPAARPGPLVSPEHNQSDTPQHQDPNGLENHSGSDLDSVLEGVSYLPNNSESRRQLAPRGAIVAALGIDLANTHGFNRDQVSGDEGVQVVVTPLDQHGRVVLESGDFELSLYDYSKAEDVEIGTWKFSRATIDQFIRKRGSNAIGIPFRVALKNYVLQTPEVMAEVRMRTSRGKLVTVREIVKVKLAEDWVKQPPFSLDGLPYPKGSEGLAEFPNEEIVPSFIPSDSYAPVETAVQPPATPAWAPDRR